MSASNLRSSPLSLLAAISGAALLFVLRSSEAAIVVQNSMFQGQVVYSEQSGTQTSFGIESGRVCTSVIDYESSDNDNDVSALYPLNFSYPFILSNLNGSTVQESYEHVRWETNGCVYLGQLDSVSEEYDACQPGKSKQAMNSTCGIQEYEYFWAEEALEDSSFSYTNGDKAVPPIICPTQTDLAPDYGGWYSIHHCNDMTYVKSNQIAHIDFSDYVEDYGEACVFNWEVGFFKDGSLEIRFFDMCTVYQDTGESQGAVTISGGNLSNPINVCGPNCTCWDGWGGDYRITVANSTATESPTLAPTMAPTLVPTLAPTAVPTVAPTLVPTVVPTVAPTSAPSAAPTAAPTDVPTVTPTAAPTVATTSYNISLLGDVSGSSSRALACFSGVVLPIVGALISMY
mmetsp:Transcript_26297/g.39488  ORF Transcript_26297/g.39488 Transcript_26297/m.39488 type:complete len:401 (-) Transcript_26297:261-1463(-)